jgi:hypothetical protein
LEDKVNRLRAECKRLRGEVRIQEHQVQVANAEALEAAWQVRDIKEVLSLPVDIVNKAKLFDAKVDKRNHLSKSRIIRFMVEQAHRTEDAFEKMRKLTQLISSPPPTLVIQRSPMTAPRPKPSS